MEYGLSDVRFIQQPVAKSKSKHVNKLGKGINKRKRHKSGRRIVVGARLTADQMAKLHGLVRYHTKITGEQATISSVIAELVDGAKSSIVSGGLSLRPI